MGRPTGLAADQVPGAAGFLTWQSIITSATPALIVSILGAVGAAMARKGTLDAHGCHVLAQMCFYVFTPALTFSKLVQAVSLGSISHLWPLLVNMTVSTVVGLGVGALVARLTRAPREFRAVVLCAVAFGNVGNLPLVFVSTLCHDKQALFYRALGEQCEHLGIAYAAFDIAAATLWQFTLALNLIRRAAAAAALSGEPAGSRPGSRAAEGGSKEDAEPEPGGADSAPAGLHLNGAHAVHVHMPLRKEPTLSDLLSGRRSSHSSGGSSPRDGRLYDHHAPPPYDQQQQAQHEQRPGQQQHVPGTPLDHSGGAAGWGQPLVRPVLELQPVAFQPHPQQAQHTPLGWSPGHMLPGSGSSLEDIAAEDTAALLGQSVSKDSGSSSPVGAGAGAGNRNGGGDGRRKVAPAQWGRAAWRYLRGVEWGAALPLPSQAVVLGVVVGCIPPLKALLYSPRPPLRFVSEALDALGAGLIPTAIPLLGAMLHRGPGASRLPLRVTVAVVVTRLVLQPALLTALVALALRLRLFTSPDPMFLLTMVLSNATPTAINMQTLAVLYRTGEEEMASLLFWQYLASIVTLPACMPVFLRIIQAWHA